jgi:NADH dehydrogenase [ubiquinone] 1 alpha subcomplex assembly factor 7
MDIKKYIKKNGAISVNKFMSLVIPAYYENQQPFGKGGDFVTAPDISQVFGELIGVWVAAHWLNMGSPDDMAIIELGPGRGNLMRDFLRGAKNIDGFHDAISVHMVEISSNLKAQQQNVLKDSHSNINWYDHIKDVPKKTSFFVANEFFDALPINQYVKTEKGWCERLIKVGDNDELEFCLSSVCSFSDELEAKNNDAKEGDFFEINQSAIAITKDIAKVVSEYGGGGVFIDYGYFNYGYKDTLQGMKGHKFNDVLENLGEADVTAHVDFVALFDVLKNEGVDSCYCLTQKEFLQSLEIHARKEMLVNKSSDDKEIESIIKGVERLLDPKLMGELFKVLTFSKYC